VANKKVVTISYAWIAAIGAMIPVLSFSGVTIVKLWTAVDHIATKSDTNLLRQDMAADFKRTDEAIAKAVEASKKYTDEKAIQTRDDSYAHSDGNKMSIEAKYGSLYSEIATKTNMIIQALERIERNSASKK
jgi:hypothetical protein